MENGKVCYLDEGWGCLRPVGEHRWKQGTFYVHPVTKCLAYAKPEKKEPKKKPETFRILGNYHQLIKIKGFWHEVKGIAVNPESDVVVIDGLHYTKVKKLPETNEMVPAIYPPFPQKFFGRKVLANQPKFKKTEDGYYLVPKATSYYDRNSEPGIGPRDLMIQPPDDNTSLGRYTTSRRRKNSVKITVYRQLSSKELKKYGLKNDIKPLESMRCKVCGNENCTQEHNNRCNICGEKWCRTHAVKPYSYAMGLGNPIVK